MTVADLMSTFPLVCLIIALVIGFLVAAAIGSNEVDDDELPTIADDTSRASAYFEKISQEFMTMRKKCGESTESPIFECFSKRLQKIHDAQIAKHSCSSAKFQVYEKAGKAALKLCVDTTAKPAKLPKATVVSR